ncbi:MAG TPA: cyclic nucleotide-binding domain-containing protein, partial [Actinomycetota bacterium]|nr:cyclic nucleotide-binding domain-containing protein [Actinomycetota bacterium]
QLSGVADLVYQLKIGGFLDQPYVDVEDAVDRATATVSERRAKAREAFRNLRVEWSGAHRMVQWCYDHGLKYFFEPIPQVLGALVALAGIAAFVSLVTGHRFELTGDSLAVSFLGLLLLTYFLIFVHEMGHAVVLIKYGRRVKAAGIMIYFGSPAFFVESSDSLMLEPKQRIVQSYAGPYSAFIVAGVASLLAWGFPGAAIAPTLYKFSVLAYLNQFMNLIPMLELDGYWILSDLIQVPDLRPMSLAFIRHDLWHKLRTRDTFTKQETGLAVYGVVGTLFTIFSFYTAYFFWKTVFGGLVSKLWHGGAVTRLLLIVLAVFVLGPIIRGAIALVESVAARINALIQRLRFRLQTKWRVEAAELIDALPMFDDVPVESLNELAGRVRLRTFSRGQPVVRQGDRAEAFYVVRRGTLQVVEENPETGNERPLRSLGRGESFGELALVTAATRTATVRAVEESEVFEIDKSTFDWLLADMIHVPHFAPTLEAMAQLREMECFANLEPDELAELLERGEWVNVRPGETIVKQGTVADSFYAIGSGQVEVVQNRKVIRTLGAGSFFGEIGLLLDVPRTATVRALTPVRIYRLDRDGFDRIVRESFRKGTLNPTIPQDRTWQH